MKSACIFSSLFPTQTLSEFEDKYFKSVLLKINLWSKCFQKSQFVTFTPGNVLCTEQISWYKELPRCAEDATGGQEEWRGALAQWVSPWHRMRVKCCNHWLMQSNQQKNEGQNLLPGSQKFTGVSTKHATFARGERVKAKDYS